MSPDELLQHAPAVPKEWRLGLAQAVVALAVAFGAPITADQQLALVSFSALAFGLLVTAGVHLRRSRLQHLAPALTGQVPADVVDAVLEALQARSQPVATRRGPAAVRQLEAVETSAQAADEAQAVNDPDAPPPGTYAADDEPAGPEATGS